MYSQLAITRFGLLRHAETEWNKQKRIQGHSDSPLTAEGKASADQWGSTLKTLPINRIISSDLGRVRETSQTINRHLNLPVVEDMRLREQNWGQWEGLSIPDIENTAEFKAELISGWNFRPRAGESRMEVWHRSHEALLQAARKWPGDTLLVVTHEGVIRCLIYMLFGRKFGPHEPPLIEPKHLHWLVCQDGRLKVDEINALRAELKQ
ncbi:MAG TPA: histidine phosphatase family protein [Deltaproteobacteria bacterium]|nr:histidine phosphatase family protein [Deltaproteobacteria bacterium]